MTRTDKDKLFALVMRHEPSARQWAAEQGYANLKQRMDTAATHTQHASTTLALLLGGLGAALAYGLPVLEPKSTPLHAAAAAVCVWIALLAIALTLAVLNTRSAPLLHNEPGRLLADPPYSAEVLLADEIVNLQERIEQQRALNTRRARALDRLRIGAALSPLVAVLAYFGSRCFSG